jgi:D-glycero-D-manno-heptose 1,7-bisphosphate phosphatase
MTQKCVFLDRDNTLIEDPGYLSDPGAVKLMPGVDLALRSLAEAGFKLVVVTNQSAIARGLLTVPTLDAIHAELRRQLGEQGVRLDGIYYCPYHPEGTVEPFAIDSDERKPNPGMLRRAAKELDLDLSVCWMIGDSPRDVEAGQRAGCRTIRVRLKDEGGPETDEDVREDFTVRNLVDAARIILAETVDSAVGPAGELESGGSGLEQRAGNGFHQTVPTPKPPATPAAGSAPSDRQLLESILAQLQRLEPRVKRELSITLLAGLVYQVFAFLAFGVAAITLWWGHTRPQRSLPGNWDYIEVNYEAVAFFLCLALVLQVVAVGFFVFVRRKR